VLATVTSGLLIFFMFFTAGHGAQSIPLEAQSGTLARLFTTPAGRGQILLGKFLSVFLIVAVQATLSLALSAAWLDISWGPPSALALVVFGVVAGAGGFGVLLVALARSPRESSIIVSSVSAGAGMLGGLFTSAVQMPALFELCGLFVPQGWAMRSFKLLLGGAGVPELLAPAAISFGIGGACLAVGALVFRRRFS
jgi:ABC-2 type transport system permease protein